MIRVPLSFAAAGLVVAEAHGGSILRTPEDSMTDDHERFPDVDEPMEQAPPDPEVAPPTEEGPPPKRILLIQSHPDDAEFMCAGTIARWVMEGAEAHYCSITSGDKGTADPGLSAAGIAEVREQEQRDACRVLGVTSVTFLGYPDATLVADLGLRRALTRVIRRIRPDVLLCQDPTMRFSGQRYINHPDHIAAGEASLAAVFPSARDHKTFPELLEEGLEPHICPEIYIYGAREADVWVDITISLDTKIAALKEHRSQVGSHDPTERMYAWARETATQHPDPPDDFGAYAESFKYMNLDWRGEDE